MIADLIPKLAEFDRETDHEFYPRPSCAGPERCIRQMVYWGLKVERKPLPGRTLLVFDDGNWHEQLTADWIRKSSYHLHSEQMHINVAAPEYAYLPARACHTKGCDCIIPAGHIPGHIDGIITDPLGQDFYYEHKGMNHFTFERWADLKDFPLDYFTQCALGFRGIHAVNPEIERGILLVKNKNTAAYLEYMMRYDFAADTLHIEKMMYSNPMIEPREIGKEYQGIAAAAAAKFAEINRLIAARELPLRQYDLDDWHCQYCQWAAECYKNYQDEFDALATDVAADEEIAVEAAFCNQLAAQVNSDSAELKEHKSALKKRIKDLGFRKGRAGQYMLEITQQNRDGYTVAPTTFEQLNIRKIKEGK